MKLITKVMTWVVVVVMMIAGFGCATHPRKVYLLQVPYSGQYTMTVPTIQGEKPRQMNAIIVLERIE